MQHLAVVRELADRRGAIAACARDRRDELAIDDERGRDLAIRVDVRDATATEPGEQGDPDGVRRGLAAADARALLSRGERRGRRLLGQRRVIGVRRPDNLCSGRVAVRRHRQHVIAGRQIDGAR